MLIQTHYLFATYVYETMENLGYADLLSKRSFIIGNLKPDLDFNLRDKNHSIYGTPKHISEYINKIRPMSDTKEGFSENLGIMMHFLCDSFCAYHNRDELIAKPFLKHFQYEQKIHQKLCKRLAKNKIKPYFPYSTDHTLENLFLLLLHDYFSRDNKPVRDLRFALGTSLIFIEKLLQEKRKHQVSILIA